MVETSVMRNNTRKYNKRTVAVGGKVGVCEGTGVAVGARVVGMGVGFWVGFVVGPTVGKAVGYIRVEISFFI